MFSTITSTSNLIPIFLLSPDHQKLSLSSFIIPFPIHFFFSPSYFAYVPNYMFFSLGQVRPHMDLTFENILSHINTIYVLCAYEGLTTANRDESSPEQRCLRLKVSA